MSEVEETTVPMEQILAAIIVSAPQEILEIPMSAFEVPLSGKVIAIDFNDDQSGLLLTLVDEDEVTYE